MIYVCHEKDCAVRKPCEPCTCGMNNLPEFNKLVSPDPAPAAARPMVPNGIGGNFTFNK